MVVELKNHEHFSSRTTKPQSIDDRSYLMPSLNLRRLLRVCRSAGRSAAAERRAVIGQAGGHGNGFGAGKAAWTSDLALSTHVG